VIVTLLYLLAVHAVCDYPLQGQFLSDAKRPNGVRGFPWQLALASHSLIHAGGVALVTGSWWLGAAEFVAHGAIDYLKCRNRIGIWTDQAAHAACKVVWAVLATWSFYA